MNKIITIHPGKDKDNNDEVFSSFSLAQGEMCSICGNTGSGKSQLIKDIELMANRDSVTKRVIHIDGALGVRDNSKQLIAHLSQNMRFVLDSSVEEFIELHKECRQNSTISVNDVLILANKITSEKIVRTANLNELSGGQTRALMIADIALICDSPIVLIDEIENAGINKKLALETLLSKDKIVLIVTHDPQIILMAEKRIVLRNGAIIKVIKRSKSEEVILREIEEIDTKLSSLQQQLRKGEKL